MTGSGASITQLAYLPARVPAGARLYLRPAGLLNYRARVRVYVAMEFPA